MQMKNPHKLPWRTNLSKEGFHEIFNSDGIKVVPIILNKETANLIVQNMNKSMETPLAFKVLEQNEVTAKQVEHQMAEMKKLIKQVLGVVRKEGDS